MRRILYAKPSITRLELGYTADAAEHGWGERCYDYIHRFEVAFREHLGVGYAIATSSGTGAIELGMAASGIGRGDEVILADTNWIACAAPIFHLGATPVLVDVLPKTWCIDPRGIEAAITPRTKAILAVHLYGNMCDMDALLAIGARHGVPVLEDAAEAIGSTLRGRRAGSMGAWGSFSFHGTKTVSTGEGGMLVTNDRALYLRALKLSNHGRDAHTHKDFWCDEIGYKHKMSNMQAAMGLAQVERIDELVARKRQILARYRRGLEGLPLTMNEEPDGGVNGAWMPTIMLERGLTRDPVLKAFTANNIEGRPFFPPLSSMPMFKGQPRSVNAWDLSNRGLNLPSYHDMTDDDQDRVIDIVRRELQPGAQESPMRQARHG